MATKPPLGDRQWFFPGCVGVFKGEMAMGCPVYEVQVPEIDPDPSPLVNLMQKISVKKVMPLGWLDE